MCSTKGSESKQHQIDVTNVIEERKCSLDAVDDKLIDPAKARLLRDLFAIQIWLQEACSGQLDFLMADSHDAGEDGYG